MTDLKILNIGYKSTISNCILNIKSFPFIEAKKYFSTQGLLNRRSSGVIIYIHLFSATFVHFNKMIFLTSMVKQNTYIKH